jgi:hypothetical protein
MNRLVENFEKLTPKDYDYLPGFISQFGPEEGELSNDEWTPLDFLRWLKLNEFKIVKINK